MKNFIIIETTYPNLRSAKSLAKILLQKNLAACIQFFPISSIYSWEGKIKNNSEISLNIKTKNSCYKEVEEFIVKNHPYKIPQIFAIKMTHGFQPYLEWIESNIKKNAPKKI